MCHADRADYLANGNFPVADKTCPANPAGMTTQTEHSATREQEIRAVARQKLLRVRR
jgi:hypothetical protein